MSNALTRIAPKAVENFQATRSARQSKRAYYKRKFKKHTVAFSWVIAILFVITGGLTTWYVIVHHENQRLYAVAQRHYYKKGDAAWCNQSKDDVDADILGWIPCTVLRSNNPQHTQYFVTYGTQQANIPADAMRVK